MLHWCTTAANQWVQIILPSNPPFWRIGLVRTLHWWWRHLHPGTGTQPETETGGNLLCSSSISLRICLVLMDLRHFQQLRDGIHYTAKSFGQQTDSKRTSDVQTANGYKSAHATVCALKNRTTVCCSTYRINVWLFSVIIACILLQCYFLDFHWIFFSDISVNRLYTNGQQTDVQSIRAQMFGWPFVHNCSSAQIVHRNIRSPIHRTANGQQTDVQNIRQQFDICNFLRVSVAGRNSHLLTNRSKWSCRCKRCRKRPSLHHTFE